MPNRFKRVSIIIPVYNEKKTIQKFLKSVLDSDTLSLEKEIILIDDGSIDGTKEVLKNFKKSSKVKLFFNSLNKGKGFSLKRGFQYSTGDIVIIQDADLEYSPREYPSLIKPIIDGYADVIYGSRFLGSKPHRVMYFHHYIANKIITCVSNLFTNLNLSDIETGFKVFKGNIIRKIAPSLKANRFGFEPEITSKIAKIKDLRIYEIGISYYGRTYGEGKKVKWTDGLKAIFEIIKYNLFS